MAKNPIFPLYYNDIDRSTKTWTDEEFGAYMRLLMEQWDKGYIPKDYQRLTRIATSLDKNWPQLKDKFPEVDGVLKNPVLEEHRAKREKHIQKQKENISKRYQKPTKTLPLENENENEFEDEIEKWRGWGNQILNWEDQYWEQMKGRKVTQDELDNFYSVAVRNEWKMETQHAFRITLKGFKNTKNGNETKRTPANAVIEPSPSGFGKL